MADPDAKKVTRPATPKTEQRVRYVPITAYAIRFHGSEEPRTYLGRPADGGPACEPNADGAAQDGFALGNYLMWVEERTVYEVEPDDWEVGIPDPIPSDPHPCGHAETVSDCGGCDPGAIEFVITDQGQRRPFDPALDMRTTTASTSPEKDRNV